MKSDSKHREGLRRAEIALLGLSVGDAFGEQFFASDEVLTRRFSTRQIPPPTWFVTDDTIMSISVVEVLRCHGQIDQHALAAAFVRRYEKEPDRGYGGTARRILRAISEGCDWSLAAAEAFDGMGSMGNGAAMRAAPLGAYYGEEGIEFVIQQARLSAAVTHAHEEGQAGAIAVALAAKYAAQSTRTGGRSRELLEFVHQYTPHGETHSMLGRALSTSFDRSPGVVADMLGSGIRMTSQDTVPFALWCAARHLDSYPAALWSTAIGLGDVDTTCAIVGGIVALSAGAESIPDEWIQSREQLPE